MGVPLDNEGLIKNSVSVTLLGNALKTTSVSSDVCYNVLVARTGYHKNNTLWGAPG